MSYRTKIREAEQLLQQAREEASRVSDKRTCADLDQAITFCLLAQGSAPWRGWPDREG